MFAVARPTLVKSTCGSPIRPLYKGHICGSHDGRSAHDHSRATQTVQSGALGSYERVDKGSKVKVTHRIEEKREKGYNTTLFPGGPPPQY